jgi:hypothetical protein
LSKTLLNLSQTKMKKIIQQLLISIIPLIIPFTNFAQAPNLRSDSSFALFTAVGAIHDTGTTNIWGDLGTDVGALTGSPTVHGNIYIADATSAQAATDVATAYSYMITKTCDSTLSTPFGSGLVLVPGRVYCITSAAALNGDLILDGQGNANALFLFKINGALSTATSSRVILRNSASFCNVYWQVGGAVSLGKNSIFRGTLLVDGAINLLDYDTLEGRGLSIAGAISMSNNKVIGCDAAGQPVPIRLLSFSATPVGKSVQVNWTTAAEINNQYFTVLCSKDGNNFEEIYRLNGAGNSSKLLNYTAFDFEPHDGLSYYQLKQTDFDGKFSCSKLVAVNFEKTFHFNLYPNPFREYTTITINEVTKTSCIQLRMYNNLGEKVMDLEIDEHVTKLDASGLPSGIYHYNLVQIPLDGVYGQTKTIGLGKMISR